MSKTLSFSLGGFADIPLEDITFFDTKGNVADTTAYDTETLNSMLADGELNFDWLQLAEHPDFQISLNDVDVRSDGEEEDFDDEDDED